MQNRLIGVTPMFGPGDPCRPGHFFGHAFFFFSTACPGRSRARCSIRRGRGAISCL